MPKSLFAWGRYLLLVLLLFLPASPAPSRLVGPAESVVTRNPKIGVHTRLTDEVEEWKIYETLEMVREMGASYIVEYFPWAYLEPAPGRYDWRHADLVVDYARHQGLTVIARLDLVPAWARPPQ
ncbi:MAG: beta-galactosidase, partial [Chloroflexota bacterium]|nr:beta-galactosidase [Chloroflexota bacterium]